MKLVTMSLDETIEAVRDAAGVAPALFHCDCIPDCKSVIVYAISPDALWVATGVFVEGRDPVERVTTRLQLEGLIALILEPNPKAAPLLRFADNLRQAWATRVSAVRA